MIVQVVPVQHLHQLWSQVSGYLADALKYADGDYSLDQVKVFLSTGQWQLLIFNDETTIHGAVTVSYANYPNDRIAFITAIGGKGISDKDSYQSFCDTLKAHGATKIQGAARESVARLWRRLGFKNKHIIVEKTI